MKLKSDIERAFWRNAYCAALTGGQCAYGAIERADNAIKAYRERLT